jgi:hypothetical protein
VNQPWLIVLDPIPRRSGTFGCPWKAARAALGRARGSSPNRYFAKGTGGSGSTSCRTARSGWFFPSASVPGQTTRAVRWCS